MLKLKNLFDNRDLAMMLLKNWEFDSDSSEMLNQYRISSNAVYPFKRKGKTQFLRFALVCEKKKNDVLAELEYLNFLRRKGFPCLQPVASLRGHIMETKNTPWGEYVACVFDRVPGVSLAQQQVDLSHVALMGKTLAKLHLLSTEYVSPVFQRPDHEVILKEIEQCLKKRVGDKNVMTRFKKMKSGLASLPINSESYGLIHYDFEMDNLFCEDDLQSLFVIDFDDSMYHWYGVDISQSLRNLLFDADHLDFNRVKETFLSAYQSVKPIEDEILNALPLFKDFAELYQLSRLTQSLSDSWDNEPEWMTGLRYHLQQRIDDIIFERLP